MKSDWVVLGVEGAAGLLVIAVWPSTPRPAAPAPVASLATARIIEVQALPPVPYSTNRIKTRHRMRLWRLKGIGQVGATFNNFAAPFKIRMFSRLSQTQWRQTCELISALLQQQKTAKK